MLRHPGDDRAYGDALLRHTYAFVSDSAPAFKAQCPIAKLPGESDSRRTVKDTLRISIEHLFRASANPRNVLCKGMLRSSDATRGRVDYLDGSSAVSVRCRTSAHEAFLSPVWETLCSRIGDNMMLYIVLYCSLFIRVGGQPDSPLLQICGYPVNDSRRTTRLVQAMATNKSRNQGKGEDATKTANEIEADGRAGDADDSALEESKYEARPITANPFISTCDVKEVIGLSEIYRASRNQPPKPSTEQGSNKKRAYRKPSWFRNRWATKAAKREETAADPLPPPSNTVKRSKHASRDNNIKMGDRIFDRNSFMFRSSFAKKPGLPASHPLRLNGNGIRASRRLFHAIFKPKQVAKVTSNKPSKRSFGRAFSTTRVPRKYRQTLLPALSGALERARRCPFSKLLNRYAPMPQGLLVPKARIHCVSEESLLSSYTPVRRVAMFIWSCIEYIVPPELLGSRRTQASLQGSIRRILSMRRYERFTLHEIMQGVRTADFQCFKAQRTNAGNAGQVEASQRKMVCKWITWLINDLVFPLIRAHFYVTDTQNHKNRIFFYRKGIWARLVSATLQSLENTSFERLDVKNVNEMLSRASAANLGFSNMRFLPKSTGLRPLATLNKPTKCTVRFGKTGRRTKSFHAINGRLHEVFDVLQHEALSDRDVMGATVGDYRSALNRLAPVLRTIRRERLMGRKSPAYIIATDIKGAFDNLPLEALERMAVNLVSKASYQTLRYAVVKHDGRAKYKKMISSVPVQAGSTALPGPLLPDVHRRVDGGGAAMLQDEGPNAVIVDAGFPSDVSSQALIPILRAHLRENIVSARGKFFLQKVGIPQGSIISPLLCSLFYGHLEHEHKLLTRFCSERSAVCRWMDDILIVTTDKQQAIQFMEACKNSFEAYGCSLNLAKTSCSFTDEESETLEKTFKCENGRRYIPWCGLLIDCLTLEIMVDYSRYAGENVREAMNLPIGRKLWVNLPERICGFLKPKCAAIFFDESINSRLTVRTNVFQLFTMAAMKTHCYIVAGSKVPGCNQVSPEVLCDAVDRAVRFGKILIQRQCASARENCGSEGNISNEHIEYLAYTAFIRILERKQTRYRECIRLLRAKLSSSTMKRMGQNALLRRAMHHSQNAIFTHIRF